MKHVEWRLKVNADNSNVVHVRGKCNQPTEYNFLFDNNIIKVVDKYKYLGIIIIIHENFDFNITASVLASAAGKALGAVISKFKSFKNAGFNILSQMYTFQVIPVVDYNMGIQRYSKFEEGDNIQNRATRRYSLGVHQKAPTYICYSRRHWLAYD